MAIKIDLNKCTGCAKCVPACPFGLMEIVEKKVRVKEGCTLCGACKDACNFEAITIETTPMAVASGDYHGVWVFAEQWDGKLKGVSYELLAKGRELADNLQTELCAVAFGHGLDMASLAAYGAEKVYLVDSPDFARNPEDIYTRLLIDLIRQYKPAVVLAGATALGRSFIPRVAAVLGTGLTADCTGLEIDMKDKLLLQTRPTFGGNVMATIITQAGRPQMATVRPRTFKAVPCAVKKPGQIINVDFKKEQVTSKTKLLNFIEDVTQHVKLEEADIIVTGGRGLGKKENLKIIEELATAMGAAVGSSRPLVDEGWIPYSHQVGQSGKTVTPKLYIACGVSGAFQHLVGMQTSECIVAINTDPKAPIFDVATYGIVGDLFTVIPMMIKKIKEK